MIWLEQIGLLCVLSVILFGLIHIHSFNIAGLIEIRQYIIIGIVMTVLYVKKRNNVAYPLVAHIINNLGATLLLYFPLYYNNIFFN